jgi:hypothetical protein
LGRTVPSFRLALAEEELDWRGYRKHLDKKVRIGFDDMFATPRLYLSACSGAVKLVKLDSIKISIILQHYMELKEITRKREVTVVEPICH